MITWEPAAVDVFAPHKLECLRRYGRTAIPRGWRPCVDDTAELLRIVVYKDEATC